MEGIIRTYKRYRKGLARLEERDIDDMIEILKTQKIDFDRLKKRYYDLAEVSLIADYDMKFKHLEKQLNDKRQTD